MKNKNRFTHPEVSVLLSVHNGEKYLEESVRSIMKQTLQNIQIIIVDDASSDRSPIILNKLALEDSRIDILKIEKNIGLAGALNIGLDQVKAPYVARMDDDDRAHPNRLEVQKRFLDTHPNIDLAGASTHRMDKDGKVFRSRKRSLDSFAVRWQARFALNVAHPTFMFRTHMSNGLPIRYNTEYKLSQDHEMICRLILSGGCVVCLPDILLDFRLHNASVSRSRFKEQVGRSERICEEFQIKELPSDVVKALAPLRQLYFTSARAAPDIVAAAFAGALLMLEYDTQSFSERTTWLKRQTAQLLDWSLRRGGMSQKAVLYSFIKYAPSLIPALVLRSMEAKGILPLINSNPKVW